MTGRIDHALRLASLWLAWLLAMVFHVDQRLPVIFSALPGCFLLPLGAMVLIGLMINLEAWRWWVSRCTS